MAVVRELDKAKRTPQGKYVSDDNRESVRTRARVSSRRLREMFAYPQDVVTRGARVKAELLLDPVGHQHLADADAEIIKRAMDLKTVTQKTVYVMTGDGNMQFMAYIAGLKVVALPD